MIVVDSSALIAIVLEEPERNQALVAVNDADEVLLSAANYVEVAIVLFAKERDTVSGDVDQLLRTLDVQVVSVERKHAELAAAAYDRYGKGRHPAGLNFGDCFAYALAKALAAPLLFKGTDFGRTDVTPVDLGAA